jgi:hypothetical protein
MKRILLILAVLAVLATALSAIARDMVIVEIGTGTWCQYCPGAAMGADDLVLNHHRAAIVENHNGDPYANNYSNARNTYYGISSFPTAYFDGASPAEGGDHTNSLYTQYRSKVNAKLAIPSHYSISATGSHVGLVYNIAVTVTKVEDDDNTNVKLHSVLTQSGISQNWQGQTHLEFVERLMAPDQNGTAVSLTTGQSQTYDLTFTALPAWNANEFEFIFFLQNNTTKAILQGTKYTVGALENISPLSSESIALGDVALGDITVTSYTIHNWWSQDMNLDLSFDNTDFFAFPHMRDAYTIPFMEDMTFDIYFTANTAGANSANMTITTDNPGYPTMVVPITANVTASANNDQNIVGKPDMITGIAPNPFQSFSTIKYNLSSANNAELQIYNVKGAKVLSQQVSSRTSGEHSFIWSGKDSAGNNAPSGIYFCKLTVNGKTVSTQKLIKVK